MAGSNDSDKGDKGRRRTNQRSSGPFVNHEAAIAFLNSTINVERVRPEKVTSEVWKLDRMHALMRELGDPQDGLEIIHIAGSKGKGSVCNMLEGALQGCGYTTGVFTSPHLVDVRERIRIGGLPITEQCFDDALGRCRVAAGAIEKEHGRATYFELLTAMALLVFAQDAVDIVVLETGLGGRLDCTNIVKPRIVGLTHIQLEHTLLLGSTLEQIAFEKAGIIKPGCYAISVPQNESVLRVYREKAAEVDAVLSVIGDEILYTERFQSGVRSRPTGLICVGDESKGFEHVTVPLMGMHQAPNCALVLATIIKLRELGYDLPERGVLAGLSQIDQRARLECVMEGPRIYIDGAHTPESVRSVLQAVAANLDYESLFVIFGCAGDKDIDGMLAALASGADKVIFTRAAGNPRAVDPQELRSRAMNTELGMSDTAPSVRDAINLAASVCNPAQDLILVTGSFYIAGEVKALIESRAARR